MPRRSKNGALPVPVDELELWSEPAANEGRDLRVLRCVEGDFVMTRIEVPAVGKDGAAGMSAGCGVRDW